MKVRDCFATRLKDAVAEQCIEMISVLDHLNVRQVAELMALLAHSAKG